MTIKYKNSNGIQRCYHIIIVVILISGNTFAIGNKSKQGHLRSNPETLNAEQRKALRGNGLCFTLNKGQLSDMNGKPVPFVLFKTEVPGMDMYITEKGITYVFIKIEEEKKNSNADKKITTEWNRIDMTLKGASIKKENIETEGISTSVNNYYTGNCPDGILNVYNYKKIIIKNIYPNIDWVLYNSNQNGFKYDFIVRPGADPKQIELIYSSLTPLNLDRKGNIKIKTRLGTLTENVPVSYQRRKEIPTRFIKKLSQKNDKEGYDTYIKFSFPTYDPQETLTIDPQLVWATFYGGNSFDGPMSIDTDNSGNVFVTGYTNTANFPVQNAGAYFDNTLGGNSDIFILKFGNSGNLLWATYYGGTGSFAEKGCSIVTDAGGNVFVTGWAQSTDLPLQNAGTFFQGAKAAGFNKDAFILKFDNAGNRLWATYYGGTGEEEWVSITTDAGGNVFVTGYTTSTDLPVQNAGTFFQGANAGGNDAFILKFDNSGNRLWATYYGGTGDDRSYSIATDGSNNIFLTGLTASADFPVQNAGSYFDNTLGGTQDAFVLKFNTSGARLWATYYGGSANDHGNSIAIDPSGNVFIMGYTASADFPVQNAGSYFDPTLPAFMTKTFILKFDNPGNPLWATYYGRQTQIPIEPLDNLTIDQCGTVYMGVDVYSYSPSAAASWSAVTQQPSCGYFDNSANGNYDNFIACFSNTGFLLWATFMGGDGYDFRTNLVVDNNRNLFVSGEWKAANAAGLDASYPLINPGGGAYYDATSNGTDEGFMVKFEPIPPAYTQSQTNSSGCCNGSATINVSCGTPNYSYVWSNSSTTLNTASSTNTITGLCPGTYTVTATSNCNQTQTATFVITGTPCGNISAFTSDTVICSGACAMVTSNATGGTAPYTYSWNTGATSQSITSCPASTITYTVKITDSGGNASTATATVIVSPPVIGQFAKGTAGCTGCGCKHWILINATGGTSPYSYSWSEGYTNRYKNQLCPGNYTINIKDKNGCSINVNMSAP